LCIGWIGGIGEILKGVVFLLEKRQGIFGVCFCVRKKTVIMGGLQAEKKRFFRWIPRNIVVSSVNKYIY